jgi:hypothetical protein
MTVILEARSFNAAYRKNRMMSSVLARGRVLVLGALTLLAGMRLAGGAGQAHAAGATIWPYVNTLMPSGVTNGVDFAVNHESGNLLVLNSAVSDTAVLQVDESGTPVPFTDPALAGATALSGANVPGGLIDPLGASGIAVDNSGTASQGNIYVVTANALPPGQGDRVGQGHQEDVEGHCQRHGRDDHRQAHQGQARQGHGHLRPGRPGQGPQDHQVARVASGGRG